MYTNLIAMKAINGMTDTDMGVVIGVSRQTYKAKLKANTFTVEECRKYCDFFSRPFDWLFEKDATIGPTNKQST